MTDLTQFRRSSQCTAKLLSGRTFKALQHCQDAVKLQLSRDTPHLATLAQQIKPLTDSLEVLSRRSQSAPSPTTSNSGPAPARPASHTGDSPGWSSRRKRPKGKEALTPEHKKGYEWIHRVCAFQSLYATSAPLGLINLGSLQLQIKHIKRRCEENSIHVFHLRPANNKDGKLHGWIGQRCWREHN